jgi:hypothetical protein
MNGATDRCEHSQASRVVSQQQRTEHETICCNDGHFRNFRCYAVNSHGAKAFGDTHTVVVKHLVIVNNMNPTGVQITLAISDGSQLILQMDSITARSMAAQIRNLEMEPGGAP